MKFSTFILVLSSLSWTAPVSAFQQSAKSSCNSAIALSMDRFSYNDEILQATRRSFLQFGAASVMGVTLATQPASAGLLDEYGSDPSKIDAPKKTVREAVKVTQKIESDLEPNLRSNYYYPTNKKRYLPRIKKCNDAIPDVAIMIGSEDWPAAADFADKVAEDTILPMKLYTSSLLGGGTNVKVSFAKDMNQAAADFEKAQKQLSKAIAKKDVEKSTKALEDLSKALLTYRTAGKLLGPDGGGDIPSVDDIRRSASRTQKLMFEQRLKERDERIKAST
ncbi:hypothetical protein IV203_012126 [Nitzschia inconspicua]|uniref:Uncharacterized protein n=1 Tax=Nitzschia inconspicua TaxID=303405 RepID=A0A9K3PLM1_9STRA|nr:hypothetical protein IV203_012126 [Nitzschia inconspicua]